MCQGYRILAWPELSVWCSPSFVTYAQRDTDSAFLYVLPFLGWLRVGSNKNQSTLERSISH